MKNNLIILIKIINDKKSFIKWLNPYPNNERKTKKELSKMNLQKETIDKIYDSYSDIIEKISKLNGFDFKYVNLEDISYLQYERPNDMRKLPDWTISSFRDPFISNMDKRDLSKDIMNKGTYWAICATKENGKYYVYEGSHRIQALVQYSTNNNVKLKIPTLYIPKYLYGLDKKLKNSEYMRKTFSRPITIKLHKSFLKIYPWI